jgi:hypothetical protein
LLALKGPVLALGCKLGSTADNDGTSATAKAVPHLATSHTGQVIAGEIDFVNAVASQSAGLHICAGEEKVRS